MAFEFATRFLGKENVTVHIPSPSWPSHKNICSLLEINHRLYNYYDKETFGLDFEGFKKRHQGEYEEWRCDSPSYLCS